MIIFFKILTKTRQTIYVYENNFSGLYESHHKIKCSKNVLFFIVYDGNIYWAFIVYWS